MNDSTNKPKKSRKGVGGRPSKYDSINLEQLRQLAMDGKTEEEMATFFGVSRGSFLIYKEKKEFLSILKEGKDHFDNRVERKLCERAMGYSHAEEKIFCNANGEVTKVTTIKKYPPDTTACIFWLKNRRRLDWRDRHDVDQNVNVTHTVRMDANIAEQQFGDDPEVRKRIAEYYGNTIQ